MTKDKIIELLQEEATMNEVAEYLTDDLNFDVYYENRVKAKQRAALESQLESINLAKSGVEDKLANLE